MSAQRQTIFLVLEEFYGRNLNKSYKFVEGDRGANDRSVMIWALFEAGVGYQSKD